MQTAKGKSALLRVVTYGTTTPNSIDTSQTKPYDILNDNEYPRNMTWDFVECPDTGPMQYEFQTESSQWWTSLWVRNARVPLASVEVESPNHTTWAPLTRGGDGTLTDIPLGSAWGLHDQVDGGRWASRDRHLRVAVCRDRWGVPRGGRQLQLATK